MPEEQNYHVLVRLMKSVKRSHMAYVDSEDSDWLSDQWNS